ncbi:hypothetical protein F4815DRAFT_454486 [Daldinia loculata]|nr:hypothetical protein F4815DRAFT_454486 [Daldinia loculata]
MTSYYTNHPTYMGHSGYSGYLCQCGAPLDIRYQNSPQSQISSQIEYAGGYCHACYRQIPLYRTRIPNLMSNPASYPHTPWYIDNGYFSTGSDVYTWGSQRQLYQHPGIPPRVSHTYYSLQTRYPSFTSNTSYYQNGYDIPRSTEPRQQWSAGRSEYPRSPLNDETRGRRKSPNVRRHYSRERRERERSYSWERSSGTQADDDSIYSARTVGSWTTRATAGSRRSSSATSRSTINCTPSPQPDEDNIGAAYPCEIEDKQKDAVEKDDEEEEPFTVTRDGKFVLLGEQWQVPSRTEAISEAGEPVGYCDIISTHEMIDKDGNTIEVDIKEKNCKVSRTMSGGLTD